MYLDILVLNEFLSSTRFKQIFFLKMDFLRNPVSRREARRVYLRGRDTQATSNEETARYWKLTLF